MANRRNLGSGRLKAFLPVGIVALLLGAALMLAACGGSAGTTASSAPSSAESESPEPAETAETTDEEGGIAAAPEFTSEELEAEPADNWITNGGDLSNDRFSSLDEINTENVKELKGDFVSKIGSEAMATKFSAEGQALEYEGTIYIADGADDVFAIDADDGTILWEYLPHLPADPLGNIVCCGWDNRGVAMGDGMVFVSQLDGKEVALDQETGKVKWSTEITKPVEAISITSAPVYYDGRVYVGGSGGDLGARGRLTAVDAKTGKIEWRFYTVPGPGEVGHDSWPQDNDAWEHGGAPLWNTPSVDPKLNMVYFSTGNASPDLFGGERKGDDLFTASIVALDATTGKYKWHYQEVHHDLWDFDAPSPTVLLDGEMNGGMHEAIAQPGKTGYLYVLDRKTGKPIFPIPEKPVPQDPRNATSPTQPMPTLPPFSPQFPTKTAIKLAEEAVAAEKNPPRIVPSPLFHPFDHNHKVIHLSAPDNVGGDNWSPSSFDPERDMYFVCSQTGATGGVVEENPVFKKGMAYREGGYYLAGEIVSTGDNTPGLLTAYDLSRGKIAWQDKFPESCYSGAVATAGGLVFVGQNNGEVQAFDSETGKKLWGFQTGGGANTTVTVFEAGGEEKVAIYAGGNQHAGTLHSENFWVFSLGGTMGPEKAAQAPGAEEEEEAEAAAGAGAAAPGDPEAGSEVFAENCSSCHGATGHGGNGGPDLRTMPLAKTEAGSIKQVTDGGGGMPPFKGVLSEEEINNVAAYVVEDIVGK